MKEIIYKGKKVKVPFEDANYTLDGVLSKNIMSKFLDFILLHFAHCVLFFFFTIAYSLASHLYYTLPYYTIL